MSVAGTKSSLLRGGIFAVVICSVLAAPAVVFFAQKVGVSLPPWLTGEDAAYLTGAVTEEGQGATSFLDGSFQNMVQADLDAHMPLKSSLLLTNARIQRGFIGISNALFHWPAYPTFFGSDYVFIPESGMLSGIPSTASDDTLSRLERFVGLYDGFAQRHPGIPVSFYCIPKEDFLASSPVASLVSAPYSDEVVKELLLNSLQSVHVIDPSVSYPEFCEGYFSTDHHWNMAGAYEAYASIVEDLGWDGATVPIESVIEYAEPEFRGSLSRLGLYDVEKSDGMFDYDFDLPDYDVKLGEEGGSLELLVHRQMYEDGRWDPAPYTSRYAEYFHADKGHVEITNPEAPNHDSVLIVAYSYSNCVERLFASHFEKTYVYDPRASEGTLDEYMAEHPDITEVLFFLSPANIDTERAERILGAA